MFLGHRANLKAKARGDNSMPEKRGPLEDAEGVVPQDPRDTAKAGLPQSQSPAVKRHTRCYSVYNAASPGGRPFPFADCHLRLGERWVANLLKGMSGTPKSCSMRSAPTERGMAYRARAPGPRSPRSSRRWGEPTTGRRGTGGATSQRGRVRDGRLPEPSGCRPTGELLEIERLTSSSERGGWKSACPGNSPAA